MVGEFIALNQSVWCKTVMSSKSLKNAPRNIQAVSLKSFVSKSLVIEVPVRKVEARSTSSGFKNLCLTACAVNSDQVTPRDRRFSVIASMTSSVAWRKAD